MPEWINILNEIALFAGGIIALVTVIISVNEYRRQGQQKRVELYLALEKRIVDNPSFQQVRRMLVDENPKVAKLDHKLRTDYAGFFETIAILTYSGFMRREVACHMFSWDAIQCWDSKKFWEDLDKSDEYWGVLRHFIEEMRRLRPTLKGDPKKCKI